METPAALNARQSFFLILLLGILDTITPFSIDMYLPAFPKIAADFDTTIQSVSLSASTYFLGFALGQILYGPLLDRFGRKRPLYAGLVLYIIASLCCVIVHSIGQLLLMRFLQALGGCVASVAAIALVSDLFPPNRSASVISFLVLVIGISPLLAPTVGSFVIAAFNWHYIFILLAAIVAAVLVITIFFLPAGRPPDTNISLKPKPIISTFKYILVQPRFYVYILSGTFSFAGLFIYVAGSAAVFMDGFHLTAKQYGGVFALLSVGFIGGSQLNHLLTRKFSNEAIFKVITIIQCIVSVIFAAFVIIGKLYTGGYIVFLFLILICAGISFPNAAAIALAPFAKHAGSASSLMGFLQIGIGGIASSAVGLLHFNGNLSISLSMAITALIAMVILLAGQHKANAAIHLSKT